MHGILALRAEPLLDQHLLAVMSPALHERVTAENLLDGCRCRGVQVEELHVMSGIRAWTVRCRGVEIERGKPFLLLRFRPECLCWRHVVIGLRRHLLERTWRIHRGERRRPRKRQRLLDPCAHVTRNADELVVDHKTANRLERFSGVRNKTLDRGMFTLNRFEDFDWSPRGIDDACRFREARLLRSQLRTTKF